MLAAADMLTAPFWEGQVHDCQTGSITAVATSFDDSYLISAAQDGTLYLHVGHITLFFPAGWFRWCHQGCLTRCLTGCLITGFLVYQLHSKRASKQTSPTV